jgi:gluconokinase
MDIAQPHTTSDLRPDIATMEASPAMPSILVVMGVSSSGKSTIGTLLANQLHWEFEDGDWFHPASNVEKMHSGQPLTDEDRWPWLNAIAAFIDASRKAGKHVVIACSALKRSYRAIIVGDRPDVRLIYLKGDIALIARRIAARHEHFMPLELLQSQFDALEEPGPEENPIVVSVAPGPRAIVMQVLSALDAPASRPQAAPEGR